MKDSKSKPKTPKSKKTVEQRQINDAFGRISFDIPDDIKVAMASAIMAYSAMEMAAEHFLWAVLGLSDEDGKLVTNIEAQAKFVLAKKLSKRYGIPIHSNPEQADLVWTTVQEMVEARNKMAHGVWQIMDGNTPLVASYKIPSDAGTINTEHFPRARMDQITEYAVRAKNLFDGRTLAILQSGKRPTAIASPSAQYPEHSEVSD